MALELFYFLESCFLKLEFCRELSQQIRKINVNRQGTVRVTRKLYFHRSNPLYFTGRMHSLKDNIDDVLGGWFSFCCTKWCPSPFALHHSGGASDGLPPPCLLHPGGSAVGQAACVPGGGLQGPQAGAEGTARLCHRWAGKLLCQWELRVAYQWYNDGVFITKHVSCSQQTVC